MGGTRGKPIHPDAKWDRWVPGFRCFRVVFGSVRAEWITTIRSVFHIMKPSLGVGFSRSGDGFGNCILRIQGQSVLVGANSFPRKELETDYQIGNSLSYELLGARARVRTWLLVPGRKRPDI